MSQSVAITVRHARTERVAHRLDLRRMLSDEERSTEERIRHKKAGGDYAAAHVLKRMMLGEALHCPPQDVAFTRSETGRPQLAADLGIDFSLSHADGVVMCAVTDGALIGADVESIDTIRDDADAIAQQICSKSELMTWESIPVLRRARYLLRLWTAKEAVLKAAGRRFMLPFHRVVVHVADAVNPSLAVSVADNGVASRWRLFSFPVGLTHFATIALLARAELPDLFVSEAQFA